MGLLLETCASRPRTLAWSPLNGPNLSPSLMPISTASNASSSQTGGGLPHPPRNSENTWKADAAHSQFPLIGLYFVHFKEKPCRQHSGSLMVKHVPTTNSPLNWAGRALRARLAAPKQQTPCRW